MLIRTGAILALALAAATARAASPEQDYIAARDAAIARITAAVNAEQRGPTDGYGPAVGAAEKEARAALERRLRGVVGSVTIQGMPADGALNLDTLIEGDQGFGLLDGMLYSANYGGTQVIVTTEGLFRRWLAVHKDWWGKDSEMPQDGARAVRENAFYTQAIQTDAAVVRFAELAVRAPARAGFVFAMLAARTQSEVPAKADEIFVAAARDGRVFVARTQEFDAVGPIASCDAIRAELVKQSVAAAEDSRLNEAQRRETSDALSAKSEAEFLRCFAEAAPRQGTFAFAAAAKAAQALLDRVLPP